MIRPGNPAALCAATLVFCGALASAAEPAGAKIVEVRKIWDAAPHNAFTDLIRHDGKWFCVFREGKGHVSPDGALRVLTSADGEKWESAALVQSPTEDLRDAKITVAPDGKLMLCGAGALNPRAQPAEHQSYVWYSKDGKDWGDAIPVGEKNFWLWRVTWHGDKAYGVGYSTDKSAGKSRDAVARLYKSEDGKTFDVLVPELTSENYPNESSLMFQKDGTCLCLLRRDGQADNTALLGSAKAPYTDWTWKSVGLRVGGPQMISLPDGRIVAAGRKYPSTGAKTCLWWVDPKSGTLEEFTEFPSGGDTSYPGLVFHDGLLWVSYYSSHEGKTSIYLAKVKLPEAVASVR